MKRLLSRGFEKRGRKARLTAYKFPRTSERSPTKTEEKTRQSFTRRFNQRVALFVRVSRKEQLALVTPMVVELTREMLFSGVGRDDGGVNGLRKRRRNTIITSPQIYEDREIEIFVPRRARRHRAALARSTEHFQLWHYNLLPLPRRMRGCCR